MKVLLVEDDLPLGAALGRVLHEQLLPSVWVRSCIEARRALGYEPFALVLLDIVLPDGSGIDVLRWIRASRIDVPVMVLSARDAVSDRVAGLDEGADDYLSKPFAVDELCSRMRALLRRRGRQLSAVWQVAGLSIDTARRRLTLEGRDVPLSPREYEILVALAADPGRVMTRAQIEAAIAVGEPGDSNALDVHVYHLRRKIGAARISTVRGVGYALEPG